MSSEDNPEEYNSYSQEVSSNRLRRKLYEQVSVRYGKFVSYFVTYFSLAVVFLALDVHQLPGPANNTIFH